MGEIVGSYIYPHPPIIIPEVGKGEEAAALKTVDAVKKASEDIKKDQPSTIIITTPHGPVFQDYIHISVHKRLSGDMGKFGASNVSLEFENNVELAARISTIASKEGIMAGGIDDGLARKYNISRKLDHGALVPLYFVNKVYSGFKLVHIAIAGLPFEDLYRFGMCIAKAVEESEERVVFLASGDLSHRLSEEGPYGYSEYGPQFDKAFIDSIKNINIEKLIRTDEAFCENAGECGLRSFLMMFGALDGYELKSEVYSYEGPYGVGYSIARFSKGGKDPERQLLKKLSESNRMEMDKIRKNEDSYVSLARNSLEAYVRNNQTIDVPKGLPEEMLKNSAGTFVSIKKSGQLRGCIGTISPVRRNIAEEIINNAISSGTGDPRFEPVEEDELDKLVYSVDVLGEPKSINSIEELDVVRYGVIVRKGNRSGLLLPNLEGVDTPEKQVSIALQKAGINPDEKYSMERFEVIRHK
ncbi:MAG: AmmeMemoRadiSam system protein A [Bacillota bacterium]|nr:AmmeMemoRadiSam system protein A [Bacillota bacterium]